ncbi:carbamate kinase [Candidatus Woesearchaeota archaeon]|nr:carbamate kinase [Candidatus Woesearchaeota archaeon]
MKKTIVIALGGNALLQKGEEETASNLIKNIKEACKNIAPIAKHYNIVISHGNGSEIGYLLLQNEIARNKIAPMPLDILGAESQGLIGYPLEEQLLNELRRNKIKKNIVTILTQVLVSKNDSAFKNPTKFIGPFYIKEQYLKLKKKYLIKEDFGRGYRRVVPSPKPIKILEAEIIKNLVKKNSIIIAGGGGGIPVVNRNGNLEGVEGVIDKDWTSSCLAKIVNADTLLILTGVDKVCLNFSKPNQTKVSRITVQEAKKYLNDEQFPPGNMGPKIEAAIDFLKKGEKAIITDIKNAEKALNGKAGTLITR